MKKLLIAVLILAASIPAVAKDKTIAELNPNFEDYIIQAMKPRNTGHDAFRRETQPLALLHFSDVHGDWSQLDRLMRFYDTYEKYFDDALCTGDVVSASHASGFGPWGEIKGSERVMIAIGNHDVLRDHKDWKVQGIWDDLLTMTESYYAYLAPSIEHWNVNYEKGRTFYYKDYEAKRVRLLVMDCMPSVEREPGAVRLQAKWLRERLGEAKEKNLAVVIAYHYPPTNITRFESNFTCIDRCDTAWTKETPMYQQIVDEFQKAGGEFVCWIGGHTHYDCIAYNRNYPKQLCICVAGTNREQSEAWDDSMRVDGTRSQDSANAFIVDTSNKLIKLIKIGNNSDNYQRPKNRITIKYDTRTLITQD
ncbi:MAG: metallophosphatase family protein [Abditibacteriota bacterium]|nr:metallophosphatase family protein [Abditibacteriota bacterium]